MVRKKVTFKLTSCNWNPRTTTCIVRNERPNGDVEVNHMGWKGFVVRKHEIISMTEVN